MVDICPDDDPIHDKYHRRSKAMLTVARALRWPLLATGTVFVVSFPVGLWTGDWVVVRRSSVFLFIAVSCGLLLKLLVDSERVITKMEMGRLAAEHFSVSGQAEQYLRTQEEYDGE